MTAALVVMPHKRSGIPPLTALSMGMIFTWWLFIYAYLVLPWQYVLPAPELYSQAFNSLYTIEDVVFIGLLALLANNARGAWRKLYVGLLGGSVIYAAGTVAVNHVITQKRYYTGSMYDLLFLVPVAWLAYVAADFRADDSAIGRKARREIMAAKGGLRCSRCFLCPACWFGMHYPTFLQACRGSAR